MLRLTLPAFLLTFLMALFLSFPLVAIAQGSGYTVKQITTDPVDHRYPAITSQGDMLWCQQDANGHYQVFKNGSQLTTDAYDHKYPVISDAGDVVYVKYGVGGGVGRQVIKHPDTVIEFSSRNSLSGAHRDAGEHAGIASDGTIIWYYDFDSGFGDVVRRLNVSGKGRIGDDFSPGDFPDINATGQIVYSAFGQTYLMSVSNPNPISIILGKMPRINDKGDVVVIADTHVQVYHAPDYTKKSDIHTGVWADINNKGEVLFEDFKEGHRQIFKAVLSPAITISVADLQGQETNQVVPSNLRLNLSGLPSPLYDGFNQPGIINKRKVQVTIPPQSGLQPPYDLNIYVEPTSMSGGHLHNDNPRKHGWLLRPQDSTSVIVTGPNADPGMLDYSDVLHPLMATTDNDGMLVLTYCASEISGEEKITVALAQDSSISNSTSITIAVPNLVPLSDPNIVSVRKSDTSHPDSQSFFGTPDMIRAMKALATNYFAQTGKPLPVNDMSLPTGGLFDIDADWNYNHIGHKAGLEADIGLVPPAKGAKPTEKQQTFNQILMDQGWWINKPNLWSSEGNHYHLNLSTQGGKVTLRFSGNRAEWRDKSKGILAVTISMLNIGGLDADSIVLTNLWSVNGVQIVSPIPYQVVGGAIIQVVGEFTVLVQIPTNTVAFSLRFKYSASDSDHSTPSDTGVGTMFVRVPN